VAPLGNGLNGHLQLPFHGDLRHPAIQFEAVLLHHRPFDIEHIAVFQATVRPPAVLGALALCLCTSKEPSYDPIRLIRALCAQKSGFPAFYRPSSCIFRYLSLSARAIAQG